MMSCYNCKSDVSKEYYCEQKMIYKRLLNKKKCSYKHRRLEEIELIRLSKPRAFWKFFRKKNQTSKESISLNDFYTYFSNLENYIFTCRNEESEIFCENHDFNGSSVNDEFDRPISADEVLKAVKKIKINKAYGMDCLLNEYFIETIDIYLPFMCDIFNAVLDSGVFPDSWSEGIVIPLHKKGDTNDVNNYRGITLLSCFFQSIHDCVNFLMHSLDLKEVVQPLMPYFRYTL